MVLRMNHFWEELEGKWVKQVQKHLHFFYHREDFKIEIYSINVCAKNITLTQQPVLKAIWHYWELDKL